MNELESYEKLIREIRPGLELEEVSFNNAGLLNLGSIVYHYGESFMNRFYKVYADAETYLKRARFYAGEKEIRWLLTGMERNDVRWFAIHIGSAKDIKYSAT